MSEKKPHQRIYAWTTPGGERRWSDKPPKLVPNTETRYAEEYAHVGKLGSVLAERDLLASILVDGYETAKKMTVQDGLP